MSTTIDLLTHYRHGYVHRFLRHQEAAHLKALPFQTLEPIFNRRNALAAPVVGEPQLYERLIEAVEQLKGFLIKIYFFKNDPLHVLAGFHGAGFRQLQP